MLLTWGPSSWKCIAFSKDLPWSSFVNINSRSRENLYAKGAAHNNEPKENYLHIQSADVFGSISHKSSFFGSLSSSLMNFEKSSDKPTLTALFDYNPLLTRNNSDESETKQYTYWTYNQNNVLKDVKMCVNCKTWQIKDRFQIIGHILGVMLYG